MDEASKKKSSVCLIVLPVLILSIATYRKYYTVAPFNNNLSNEKALDERRTRNTTTAEDGVEKNQRTTPSPSTGNSSSPSPFISPPPTTNMDKLLDGLLADGFDQESCLSRYQSYLYRRPSAHKPSQHLTSRLRRYEQLHRKCRPQSKLYRKTMNKLEISATLSFPNDTAECKYIVWLPLNGLGNRMISLVSVFLYAILTDRVLLVDFGPRMSGLFCEPFLNSTWELPQSFPRRYQNFRGVPTYSNLMKEINIMESDATSVHLQKIPSILSLELRHRSEERHIFHCDQCQNFLSKIPALVIRSDQYFVPSLFMTPTFQKELNLLFVENETVFHHLGRYLFNPTNLVWRRIIQFYQAYLSKGDQRVGIQIRVFNYKTTPINTIVSQILACTVDNKLLPEIDTEKQEAYYPSQNQTIKTILITSLYPEYAQNLTNMYLSKPTKTGEDVRIYQPSNEGKQYYSNEHQVKALTDMYLLSLCDVLVTSGKSTFGYVAQGLSGLKPWIMGRAFGSQVPSPPCRRAWSMDPCFHYPPKKHCKIRDGVDNNSSAYINIKGCVDFNGATMVGKDQ